MSKAATIQAQDADDYIAGLRQEYWHGHMDQALALYRRAATKGNVAAETQLGEIYAMSHWVPRDPVASCHWFYQAAQQGYAPAEFDLVIAHGKKLGFNIADGGPEARHWLRLAADQDHPMAQLALTVIYVRGDGEHDPAQARQLIEAAASHPPEHNGHVAYVLSRLYDQGVGVERDPARALYWMQRSAEAGHLSADEALSKMYQDGQNVPKDAVMAAYWQNRAIVDAPGDGDREVTADRGLLYLPPPSMP